MTGRLLDFVESLRVRRALAGDAGQAAYALPQGPMPRPPPRAGVALRDRDDLLSAARERLNRTAAELLAAQPEAVPGDTIDQARASVLECVAALDRLQTSWRQELSQRPARNPTSPALTDGSALGQRLAAALAGAGGGALLCIGFDDLMAINDTHGREAGATAVRIVASRLVRAVRGEDTVSRVRGDEFVLLLGTLPGDHQLSHLACKLFDAISAPMSIGALRLALRPSLGVVALPFDGGSADEVLFNARSAMRRARRHHCGYALFDPFDDD